MVNAVGVDEVKLPKLKLAGKPAASPNPIVTGRKQFGRSNHSQGPTVPLNTGTK